MEALSALGGESWFRLGDLDTATHLQRTALLTSGLSLSAAMRQLCDRFEVPQRILPMSDETVETIVITEQGKLSFQHYFVREQCKPAVRGFYFRGIEQARPQRDFFAQLNNVALDAIVICPSNPFVSIDPILQLPGVRETLSDSAAPVIAVSPIVGGGAIKGPAAKMLREMNMPVSATAVANHYRDILDGFVLDGVDAQQAEAIAELGIVVHVTDTVMKSLGDRIRLANDVLQFATSFAEEK
jgi:LPPG:FO 2-phospho-L-lactate transferase